MIRKFQGFLATLILATVALVAADALAAGTFRLRTTEVQEVSGGWHIICQMSLPRAPSLAHVPMKFLFTKTMVYERALVDNHQDPVLNRQPLVNQTPSVESLDVDFSDPRGKIFKQTNFDFSLTRTRGYEAGEYQVKVRTSDGIDVGSPATIILKGDNPVVDRRSITFDAKQKGIAKVDTGLDGGNIAKNDTDDDPGSAAPANTDVAASGSAAPFIPADAYQKTPEEELKEHPKGCGCTIPGLGPDANLVFIAIPVGAGIVAARRMKRRK